MHTDTCTDTPNDASPETYRHPTAGGKWNKSDAAWVVKYVNDHLPAWNTNDPMPMPVMTDKILRTWMNTHGYYKKRFLPTEEEEAEAEAEAATASTSTASSSSASLGAPCSPPRARPALLLTCSPPTPTRAPLHRWRAGGRGGRRRRAAGRGGGRGRVGWRGTAARRAAGWRARGWRGRGRARWDRGERSGAPAALRNNAFVGNRR